MLAVLLDDVPETEIAAHVLAAAAVQVHFTRMAARLEADKLVHVADGACPVCGGMPVASMIVGWTNAANTRFCCCSVCSTLWHAVRTKCLLCGEDKGVAYHAIEGGRETVKGETCESCGGYLKLMQQIKEPDIEPFADDVATLALDMVLEREGWRRGSANPFLLGY
jgi:FdhE protein